MPATPPDVQLATEFARRIFPHARTLQVARMASGVSTWVYALHCNDICYFLRVLPEAHASFAPEVHVHTQLLAAGLHVPEVVYFEHLNELFARSVMVTTEIPGAPLARDAALETVAPILREAGRELAILNQVAVAGFGWIERTGIDHKKASAQPLCGENATYQAWMRGEMDAALARLRAQALLPPAALAQLAGHVAAALERFDTDQATLAHGDFDVTHIFHAGGHYTGLIDFGEIRGAFRLYDVGHFAIEQAHMLAALLEGYGEIVRLPDDVATQIQQASLLVAVARAARRLARHRRVLAADRQVIVQTLGNLPTR